MILQRRRHIHFCIYFRVTTLLADRKIADLLFAARYRILPEGFAF